jgi:glyoxylase-like metal-dependent hydrolase (beta-lactamase superfamily II)
VILLPAGNPSAWTGPTGNNTFLVPGAVPTLVDAGVGHPDHLDAVARALNGARLALLLITHGHADHVQGVPAIVRRWPDVRVRQFGSGPQPLADNERVDAGDSALTVLHTPGHAPDHCCFAAGRDVLCGDLVRMGGTVMIPATRGGNLREYLASLGRVHALDPERLLPAHGPIIERPRALIDEYVRHRAGRERQILDVLSAGPASTAAIVSRVYAGLSPALVPAATESTLAHLFKLQEEGRIVEHAGVWTVQAG